MIQPLTALQSFYSLGTVRTSVKIYHWVSQQGLSQRKGYSNSFVRLLKTCRLSQDSSRNCGESTSFYFVVAAGSSSNSRLPVLPTQEAFYSGPLVLEGLQGVDRYSGQDTGTKWHQVMGTLYLTFLMCRGLGVWRFWPCCPNLSRYIQNYQQFPVILLLSPVAPYMCSQVTCVSLVQSASVQNSSVVQGF